MLWVIPAVLAVVGAVAVASAAVRLAAELRLLRRSTSSLLAVRTDVAEVASEAAQLRAALPARLERLSALRIR